MSYLKITVHESAKGSPIHGVLVPLLDTLKISKGKITPGLPYPAFVSVRIDKAMVVLMIEDKAGTLSTREAHEAGMALMAAARGCEPYELVIVSVSGDRYAFSPLQARQLARSLLMRADSVDEIQLTNNLRIVK